MRLYPNGQRAPTVTIPFRQKLRRWSSGPRVTELNTFPFYPSPSHQAYARSMNRFWTSTTSSMGGDSKVSPDSCSIPIYCWRMRLMEVVFPLEACAKPIAQELTICGTKNLSCSFVRTTRCSTFQRFWWLTPDRLWMIKLFTGNHRRF